MPRWVYPGALGLGRDAGTSLCSWYKDQEPLEFSYPGYLALGEAQLSIIANAVNEGTYTCVVRRHQRVLTTYSWRVRLRS